MKNFLNNTIAHFFDYLRDVIYYGTVYPLDKITQIPYAFIKMCDRLAYKFYDNVCPHSNNSKDIRIDCSHDIDKVVYDYDECNHDLFKQKPLSKEFICECTECAKKLGASDNEKNITQLELDKSMAKMCKIFKADEKKRKTAELKTLKQKLNELPPKRKAKVIKKAKELTKAVEKLKKSKKAGKKGKK